MHTISPPALTPEQGHRRAVLATLLVVTALGGAIFFVINIARGDYPLAAAELAMGTYAGGLLGVVRRTQHLRRWTLAYLIPFLTVMMFALAMPGVSATIFVWVMLIPVVSHLLLGRRYGLWLSAIYLGLAGVIYVVKHMGDPTYFNPAALGNVVLCAASIFAFSHIYEMSRQRAERRLLDLASTDPLTGLANRAKFREVFSREYHRHQRHGSALSLLLIDMDHFKRVNDRFGHDTGDAALRLVSAILGARLRIVDLACRMGGEEFAVLLPDTELPQAAEIAEQLRNAIAREPLRHKGREVTLTVTVGAGQLGVDGHTLEELYAAVDARLYTGKAAGRNRIVAGAAATA